VKPVGSHGVYKLILFVFIFSSVFPTLDIRPWSWILSNSKFGTWFMYYLLVAWDDILLDAVKI